MYKNNSGALLALLPIFVMIILAAGALAGEPPLVLMLPVDVNSQAQPERLKDAVTKGLVMELTQTKALRIKVLQFLDEKDTGQDHILNLARKAGASYILRGSVLELGGRINIDVRMIDVNTGKALPGVSAQAKGLDNLQPSFIQLRNDIIMQTQTAMPIARIEFKGNRKIEVNAIRQVLTSTEGKMLSEAGLSADIKAIYRMGYFDDVTAETTDTAKGKVVTFLLQEKPAISEIKIDGNKEVGKEDIEGVLTFKIRQVLNLEKIKESIVKIKVLYDNKGYYNAEINETIEKLKDKDVRVVLNIKENERLYVREISFEGNKAFTDKELKELMKLDEWGIFHFVTDSGLLKKEELKQDTAKIHAFYLNNGYINAQVGEPVITFDKDWIYVKILIIEGKPYRVGKISIAGDMLKTSRDKLMKNLKIAKKDFYDREAIIKDMEYLTQACNDEGYAYADVNPQTSPNEKEQKVDIVFNITKGNQVYFHRITITGNTKTRDKVIRRQLAIVEGDLYSNANLKKSYMELNRLHYFEEIDFQSEKGPADNLTDVGIHVKEKPTGIFSIGAGYSASDGAVLTGQVTQQNLFGRGQTLSVKASLGTKTTQYEVSFVEPWLFDIPLWTKIDAWTYTRTYDAYDLNSTGVSTTFGYPIWQNVTGYVGYKFSQDTVENINPFSSPYILAEEGTTITSDVTVSLTRDTTDDPMFPSTGSRNSASIDYAGGIIGGDASFTRYSASSGWFFPLPLETVFSIRGRGGYIQGNQGKEVPIYERFYLGGINSIRGLRSVGPEDPFTGDVIGGLTMLCFNTEFIFPLLKNAGLKGVIFFDTGNAWISGYHFNDMRKTAGAGIRWYSPIGPLRLEYGFVLDPREGDPSGRWEFTIGMFM
ncbi:MAG: outer membrane protein assembly factor BamA [Syntrophales bacterium]